MSLTSRVTSIAVLILLLVIGCLTTIGMVTRHQMEGQIQDALLTGNILLWKKLQEEQYDNMYGAIKSLGDEYELRKALKKNQHDEVRQYAGRFVELTAGAGSYDDLIVLSNEKAIVYQSAQASLPETLLQLLADAEAQKKPQRGIVDFGNGLVASVLVDRARSRKKIIGYWVLAKRFAEPLDLLSDNLQQSVALYAANQSVIHQSPLWLAQGFADDIYAKLEQPMQALHNPDHSYLVTRQPITDIAGSEVADLVIAVEDTAHLRSQRLFDYLALAVLCVITVLGLLSLSYILKRYLAPLRNTAEAASKIADGQLDLQIEVRGIGEIAQMEESMQQMLINLRDMVSEISRISEQINTSAVSVDRNMGETHRGFGVQNQNIEAISQRLEDIAGSISQVADNATEAANAATMIQQESSGSHDLMKDNRSNMTGLQEDIKVAMDSTNSLNELVGEVSNITSLIETISEQTNLLALNAAIEAARAGEQGRGFAVVADEVRTLANRTKDSTNEIESIVSKLSKVAKTTVNNMEHAHNMVTRSFDQTELVTERLTSIHQHIVNLDKMSQVISSEVDSQNGAVREVGDNMNHISQAAEQNLASSEQVSRASHQLSELSKSLNAMTRKFKFGAQSETKAEDAGVADVPGGHEEIPDGSRQTSGNGETIVDADEKETGASAPERDVA